MSEVQRAMDAAAEAARRHRDENIAAGGACDFCNRRVALPHVFRAGKVIVTSLEAIDTDTLETASLPMVDDTLWGACAACAPVVREHDPERLAGHVLDSRAGRALAPELAPAIRADLVDLYRALFDAGLEEVVA